MGNSRLRKGIAAALIGFAASAYTETNRVITAKVTITPIVHTNQMTTPGVGETQKILTMSHSEEHWICYTNAGKVFNVTNYEQGSTEQRKFNAEVRWVEVPLSAPAPSPPPLPY